MKRSTVLSIAGSDPSGGAGIQADLKTMTAFGCYGMTAITAVTVQNTMGVSGAKILSADLVAAQIDAVFTDIRPDAVKIGMAGNAAVIRVMIVEPIGIISMPSEAGTAKRMTSFQELLSCRHGIRSNRSSPCRL